MIDGFDLGASPREFAGPPKAQDADPDDDERDAGDPRRRSPAATIVLLGSLLNLSAVATAARTDGGDVAIVCSGFKGTFALDDAYCAGKIVTVLDGEPTDAAIAAEVPPRIGPRRSTA